MKKQPAFFLYSADFLVGTMLMTDAQVGQYIRLLCLQHQKGRLSEDAIKKIFGGENFDMEVLKNFKRDLKGNYFNERLENEIDKGKNFSKNQSDRVKKRYQKSTETLPDLYRDATEKHTETIPESYPISTEILPIKEYENENENENEVEKPLSVSEKKEPKAKKPNPLTEGLKPWIEVWFDFVLNRTGIKPVFNAIAARKLGLIRKYIIEQGSGQPCDPEAALMAFKTILNNWHLQDSWIQQQFDLNVIYSKITIIVNAAKNGNSNNGRRNTSVSGSTLDAAANNVFGQ